MANFTGTTGDDIQDGTSVDDTFDYSQGGHDILNGLDGNDTFILGGVFDAGDKIDGGSGFDELSLNGNYATGITFAADTIQSIEKIDVAAGHSYKLTLVDANVAVHSTLQIDGSALGLADILTLNGAALRHGTLSITGGAGNDVLTGGNLDDTLLGGDGNDTLSTNGGTNIVDGGNGNDNITARQSDFVTGGGGNDHIAVRFEEVPATLRSVDAGAGDDVVIINGLAPTFTGTIAAGALWGGDGVDDLEISSGHVTLAMAVFDAATSGFEEFNSSATISGDDNDNRLDFGSFADIVSDLAYLVVGGGGGDDVIVGLGGLDTYNRISGGQGDDRIVGGEVASHNILEGDLGDDHISGGGAMSGGAGKDILKGSGGQDFFLCDEVSDSTGPMYDTVKSFNTAQDRFALGLLPHALDAEVTTGTLNGKHHFNGDLAIAIDGTKLAAGDAVLFTPDAGSLAGQLFLIVDANGVAGYQAHEDYVVRLVDPHGMDAFGVGDFI